MRVIDAVVDGEAGAVLDGATDERGPLQWAGIAGETSADMLANRIGRVQRTDAVRREFDRRCIHHVTVDDPAPVGIFGWSDLEPTVQCVVPQDKRLDRPTQCFPIEITGQSERESDPR
ncbi:hypothetical protein GCM10020255_104270 [Rhodococcus baikonurensis]